MAAIIRFLSSLSVDGNIYPGRPYVMPRRGDAKYDFSKISSSMRAVGADLRKAADKELQSHVK